MSSVIQALSWQKIRYTSRNVTDADHAERTGLTSPQVSVAAEYPAPTRSTDLTTQHRDLVAQDQDLDALVVCGCLQPQPVRLW
jgi:hypothetical protein